jgi:histidinol-phosphate aminotransferase
MKPYSSARDEFHGDATTFLDANENPFDSGINRYPDPMQWEVKKLLGEIKGCDPRRIFLGNGSDEAIDLLMRAFCVPGVDNIVSIDPSYGMYEVAANVNDLEIRKQSLGEDFDINVEALLALTDNNTKLIYLCSPNNPTGNSLSTEKVLELIRRFDGLVVVDEAYIDFSPLPSFVSRLSEFPNLVILQTLSKAYGAAGIRMGIAMASEEIIGVLNKIKYPYNINILTQRRAIELLSNREEFERQLNAIVSERDKLGEALKELRCVKTVFPSHANFFLTRVTDANGIYQYLVDKGIIVRNRTNVSLCAGCIRITVGTPAENALLIDTLKEYE